MEDERDDRRRNRDLGADLVRIDVREQLAVVSHLARWVALGALVGGVAGTSSAAFLESLSWATRTRERHEWLLYLLPLAGLLVGWVYHRFGGRSSGGNSLIIDEIHEPTGWVPTRMAPLVLGGTIATHLFGGSAGREGTAIQMSGSLTDLLSRLTRLRPADRRIMLIAAMGGGFGAVFGVPVAGCVFALEVQAIGWLRYDALVAALSASITGDLVVRALGVTHTAQPRLLDVELTVSLVARVALAGVAFGLTSVVFIELVHGLKRLGARTIRWAPLRPAIGGVIVILLALIVRSREYLGLSLPLLGAATAGGAGVVAGAFALKLLFTAVTLGSGFQGGEVTPLFVIGATLGVTLGRVLHVPIPLMAAVGFVAVFAGAANTPLACTVMGVELFGSDAVVPIAVGCVVAYVCSSHRGIYGTQRIGSPKALAGAHGAGTTLEDAAAARRRRRGRAGDPADEPR